MHAMPESIGSPALWAGFIGFVLLMLALDLGVFHKKAHAVSMKEAAIWSAVWLGLAGVFAGVVFWQFGAERGVEFATGYLIEKSLAIDNIFVFVVLFSLLGIPAVHQHRVLFWGILGALVFRSLMIVAGAAALAELHWLMYVFGGFLLLTGVKLFVQATRPKTDQATAEPTLLRWLRRVVPTSPELDGDRFFTRRGGRRLATPLFLALLLVELSDIIFAVDSIPAIFAVTRDPFIVYTSNIFAILGLRSLYFFLAGIIERFRYLKVGLAGVLVFVGVKMCLLDVVKIPPALSLAVIALILGGSVVWSLRATAGAPAAPATRPLPTPPA
ncbi:MAG: TerC family protein [Myxococcota bacterium]